MIGSVELRIEAEFFVWLSAALAGAELSAESASEWIKNYNIQSSARKNIVSSVMQIKVGSDLGRVGNDI